MKKYLLSVALATICALTLQAQTKQLTLEEAMSGGNFRINYPNIDLDALDQNEAMPYEDQKDAADETLSDKERFVLRFTNRQRVWRYATRGDFYLYDRESMQQRQLGADLPTASLMFAKISPDGTKVAYVSKNNIYMEDCNLTAANRRQITTDGNDTIVNGTFDWVYEEEFDCRDGFRWSGDSRYIAFWRSNTAGTGWFDIINNVDDIYPTIQHFPYPKAGTTNSAVKIGFIDLQTGKTSWLPIPGDERENYLPRMEFIPGTNTLMIQQMNRPQNHNKVWTCTLKDGMAQDLKVLCEDTDEAWVETNDDIHWLPGNKFFIFTSERDGWRHLYRVSADGKKWTCITKGNFDVINEVEYDEKRGYIYFVSADPNQAADRILMRTSVMGKGEVENITKMCHPNMESGQYSYSFSPNLDYALETYSNANHVPVYNLVRMDKKGRWSFDKVLEDNAQAQQAWEAYGLKKEMVKCKSGDLELDAWIIKPANFDPSKKYPVIDYVYGEPASATVQNRWEHSLFWHHLASLGYVVVSIENRGAATPRGRQWRKCIYGEVGVAASEDQAQGIMDLCRQFPWMDSTRLGITGWSGGGAQTLNSMFRYPDVFKTGVAIAFVSDQRLYDTIYQERYMNTPQNNPDGYFRGSPISYAAGLKGNLLLLHGTGDDNVHYQNTEKLVNELVRHGKTFYQVSYPMRTHGISEGQGTSQHLRRTLIDFFQKNL
jgi:dipeptidyl-peptidase-4